MFRGMYAGISGLEAHQTMLDVTANNIANSDTIGYKSSRTTFVDQLSQMMQSATGPNSTNAGSNSIQVGLGVQLGSIDNIMNTGSTQSTGNPLDVSIQGDGFLRVGNGAPPTLPANVQYTRAGDLTLNPNGFLCNTAGMYVVGFNAVAAGNPPAVTYTPGNTPSYIQIPNGSIDVAIGQDGSVSYVDQNAASATYQQRVTAGYISLATFPNEAGLQRDGGSLWSPTANSGPANVSTPNTPGFGATIAGTLEMSNVDLATEFTNMIVAQRGYEANSKVITTGNQMMQTLDQMVQ